MSYNNLSFCRWISSEFILPKKLKWLKGMTRRSRQWYTLIIKSEFWKDTYVRMMSRFKCKYHNFYEWIFCLSFGIESFIQSFTISNPFRKTPHKCITSIDEWLQFTYFFWSVNELYKYFVAVHLIYQQITSWPHGINLGFCCIFRKKAKSIE